MQFTILIEPSLVIITMFVWFMLKGTRRGRVLKNISFSLYDLYGLTYDIRTPAQRVVVFIILLYPSVVINIIYLVCLIYAHEQRRRFLKKYTNFTLSIPKLSPLKWESWNLLSVVLLPYRCYIPNLVTIWIDKMLTDNDGRQTIATQMTLKRYFSISSVNGLFN